MSPSGHLASFIRFLSVFCLRFACEMGDTDLLWGNDLCANLVLFSRVERFVLLTHFLLRATTRAALMSIPRFVKNWSRVEIS